MKRLDVETGEVLYSAQLPLEYYDNGESRVHTHLMRAADGTIYLFYNTTTGDLHLLSSDLQLVRSWNVLPDDDYCPYNLGLGQNVVQELPNGDIALIAQRYRYDGYTEPPSPSLLVIIPYAMLANEGGPTEPSTPVVTMDVYPNPFNPETTIRFDLPQDSNVNLSIYNLRGQKVTTLMSENCAKGPYHVVWNSTDQNGRSVAFGIYLYRLNAAGKSSTRKCLLLK